MQPQFYRGLFLECDPTFPNRWIARTRDTTFCGTTLSELKQKIDRAIENRPFTLASALVNNPDTAALLKEGFRHQR